MARGITTRRIWGRIACRMSPSLEKYLSNSSQQSQIYSITRVLWDGFPSLRPTFLSPQLLRRLQTWERMESPSTAQLPRQCCRTVFLRWLRLKPAFNQFFPPLRLNVSPLRLERFSNPMWMYSILDPDKQSLRGSRLNMLGNLRNSLLLGSLSWMNRSYLR